MWSPEGLLCLNLSAAFSPQIKSATFSASSDGRYGIGISRVGVRPVCGPPIMDLGFILSVHSRTGLAAASISPSPINPPHNAHDRLRGHAAAMTIAFNGLGSVSIAITLSTG
jgi:hypothetical protein